MKRRLAIVAICMMVSVLLTLSIFSNVTAQDDTEANMETTLRIVDEIINCKDMTTVRELFAHVKWHFRDRPGSIGTMGTSHTQIVRLFRDLCTAFPDIETEVLHMAAQDDLVWFHYHTEGTFENLYIFGAACDPSGEVEIAEGVFIFRFNEDGLVSEIWQYETHSNVCIYMGFNAYGTNIEG